MNEKPGGEGKRAATQQTGSGLTRYRSAPSSYFAGLAAGGGVTGDGFGDEDFAKLFNPRAISPETQQIFSRFMNSSIATADGDNCYAPPPLKQEADHAPLQRSGEYLSSYSTAAFHHPRQNSEENLQNKGWSSYSSAQIKMEGGGGGGLIRHRSSPAGFFADMNIETGRFDSPMDFSSKSKPYTSAMMMAPISEMVNKATAPTDPTNRQFDDHCDDGGFIADYLNSWDDESALLSDNVLQGPLDKESKRFANVKSEGTSAQGNESWNHPETLLSHHLSFPAKMSAELSMEKLLQDSVPCKLRAKRGCATHPRSIAERVRRTKISERIRKLQELVPNMEKQTNTSDMLDFAVDYIKDLQGQVKMLSENREKCTCPAKNMF